MTEFDSVVRNRRSVRQFLPTPVPSALLEDVFAAAQLTPSNCNTQPWQIHVLSGEARDAFSTAATDAFDRGHDTGDFSFAVTDYEPAAQERARAQGASYYEALGITRDDRIRRRDAIRRNLTFFDAPHVALLFAPSVGDNVRIAADLGMYAQTFLLTLVDRGLAGIPQTMLGSYSEAARSLLGLGGDMKMLFGISFGYPDTDHPAANFEIGRIPITRSVFHHSTLHHVT